MSIPNIDFFAKLITFFGVTVMVISGLFIYGEYNKNKDSHFELSEGSLILQEKAEKLKNVQSQHLSELKQNVTEQSDLLKQLQSGKIDLKKINQKSDELEKESKRQATLYEISFSNEKKSFDSVAQILGVKEKIISAKELNYVKEFKLAFFTFLAGLIIFFVGINLWYQKEVSESNIVIRQNLGLPTYSKECQSCGKKFDSITVPGSDKNDAKNYNFCHECFQGGVFITSEVTLREMQEKTKISLASAKIDGKKAERILKKIEFLDRWNPNKYF